MKKFFITALIAIGLGIFARAQGSKDLFDVKKSEAELEIMKGILGTTIFYIEQNQQKDISNLNTTNMSAYYLVGQGAVFVIPASTFRSDELSPFLSVLGGQNIKLNLDLSKIKEQTKIIALEAQKQAAEIEKQAAELSKAAAGSGIGSGVGPGIGSGKGSGSAAPQVIPAPTAPPQPQARPALPAPPAPRQIDREEILIKVDELQKAMKRSRAEAAANQQKFLENLKGIRVVLIEALANYGDSLTQVKPGEYINLILSTNTFDDMDSGRMRTRYNIISAQKSWITDYKAGRISLENFKQKVLQYTQ